MLSGNEIRTKFVEYFRDKLNHKHMPSSSLIPDNPTVLLTPAGMLQFVPIFLGYEAPPEPPRVVTHQKCVRAGGKDSDIENVGRTPRHHTFFEMLGNFSFGDYFKKEIIPWAWDFVTKELGLAIDRLWITIYEEDEEAFEIWNKDVGIPAERIIRCGKKDNFWGPPGPTGPCGPCTEIHYDLGEEYTCGDNCQVGRCDCDRYVEVWNLVFMELFLDEDGQYSALEKKNVDTGMGLERVTMCVQNKLSTFETDLLQPILDKVCQITGKEYNKDRKTDTSLRIISDHARCVTFLVADGLIPGNIGRNYVLRMILRRALRHGKILGVAQTFLYTLVDDVINQYKEAYPDLEKKRDKIIDVIKTEEERFSKTIDRGMVILYNLIEKTLSEGNKMISGKDAFTLYDTYGFPLELTIEIASEENIEIDIDGFVQNMKEQKERARQAHVVESLTDALVYADILKEVGPTKFDGYDGIKTWSKIQTIIKDGKVVEEAEAGDLVEVILDKTPFYGEAGGQVGDTGTITVNAIEDMQMVPTQYVETGTFMQPMYPPQAPIILPDKDFTPSQMDVFNSVRYEDLIIHKCEIKEGQIKTGETVIAEVDKGRRQNIARHHTATHLIHSALKKVLGNEVNQSGSMVAPDRARFDFSFNKSLSFDQLKKIEYWVNQWIDAELSRDVQVMKPEEARSAGAVALFGEKYGDKVRVVSYGDITKELCGGTHIDNTGQIHLCKIIGEEALAAGIRRLEAVCGSYALEYLNEQEKQVHCLSNFLKVPVEEISDRVEKLMDELKTTSKKLQNVTSELALSRVDSLIDQAVNCGHYKLLSARLDNLNSAALKAATEKLNDKLGDSIVIIGSHDEESGKVIIVVKVTDKLTKEGFHAGNIASKIAEICGGRGGGKPNYAQAGAKELEKLEEALSKAKDVVKALVKS
jgi:alanyl-tRNA synthetase